MSDTSGKDDEAAEEADSPADAEAAPAADDAAGGSAVDEPAPAAEVAVEAESEPEVAVEAESKPEVAVEESKPEVAVEEGKPEVAVEEGKPEVAVEEGEPEVAVEEGEPEVAVEEGEPEDEAPPPQPLVVLEEVWLSPTGGGSGLHVARYELRPGVHGLVGLAGAGKTRLCETLLGLTRAKGRVEVLGHTLPGAGPRVRAEVGYLPQDLAVYPGMTALEFATFVGNSQARWRAKQVFERLARYQVPTRTPVERLGPSQRAFLAMALALGSDPKLVIVDMPTSLDGGGRAGLIEALLSERGDASLLIASARPHELEGRCSDLLILGGGFCSIRASKLVADEVWRIDLRGTARPALHPELTCLQAGPGPSGARWIVAGDETLLPSDLEEVASCRAATYEEAVLARIAELETRRAASTV